MTQTESQPDTRPGILDGASGRHFFVEALDRRRLTKKQRAEIVLRQNALCAEPSCRCKLYPRQVEFDHVQALVHGGDNALSNFRAICRNCHKAKTRKDAQARDHGNRIALGKPRKGPPMAGSRNSPWKKRMNGVVERRD